MSTARPHITDVQRRHALLRRHRLAPGCAARTPVEAAMSMVGLHSTTPATVYLSAWARVEGFEPPQMADALYTQRSIVKQLAMRRTVFALPVEILRESVGAIGARVAASERTNLLRDLRRAEEFTDPDAWIDGACAAISAAVAQGEAYTSAQLREQLPEWNRSVIVSPGKSYGGPSPLLPRILNMMSAAGLIVRGPNLGGWHLSRPQWSSMTHWLGGPLNPPETAAAHTAMVARWLGAFGPGTETDLMWWLGSTKTAVRASLAALTVQEVDLDDGSVGYLLADDELLDQPSRPQRPRPQALLLPELDPTTMGHKQRGFYLGDHAAKIFDRNGNGGQTVWWDGRIVGGWHRDDNGHIKAMVFEDLPAAAHKQITRRAAELAEWLGDVTVRPGFPPPFIRDMQS